jgi:molybdopterin molybdotransferase/putative molybdopterin biosynthesis protein
VDYVQADTGDDFPDEFDTVIPVEEISCDSTGRLGLVEGFSLQKGDCVGAAGTAVRQGDLIADAHVRLTPLHLAMLALGGIHQLEVIRKPRVIYIPTGSELIHAGIKPERGQTIESNSLVVTAMLRQWGAEVTCYPIIKDQPAELEEALDSALAAADLVLINGGSSKGAEDFNTGLLRKKAALFRHGIRVIPGRPVGIAVIDGKPAINMPGPTFATFLAMDWCVSGLVHYYYGLPAPQRPKLKVRLKKPLQKRPDYEFYFRLALSRQEGCYEAEPLGWGQNLPDSLLKADALFVAPIGIAGYEAGMEIEAELLYGMERYEDLGKTAWGMFINWLNQ